MEQNMKKTNKIFVNLCDTFKKNRYFSDIFISDEISDNIIELTIDKQTGDKVKKFSNAHEKLE